MIIAADMSLPAGNCAEYIGTLTGRKVPVQGGRINVTVAANSGEIWVPAGEMPEYIPVKTETADIKKSTGRNRGNNFHTD